MTYSWSTTGGRIEGTGVAVAFDATGIAPGKYTITVTVSDRRNQVPCSSDITVIKKNVAPTVSIDLAYATIKAG